MNFVKFNEEKNLNLDTIYGITLISDNKEIPFWNPGLLTNEKVIICNGQDETGDLYKLSKQGSRIIAFSKKGGIPLNRFQFNNNDSLLFGREDTGLSDEVRNQCSFIATIPMPGIHSKNNYNGVRSLNLSVACGIAIYNIYRKTN